ncbi:MAG: winged helix-turn-helix domain-containing protein [Methanotrichaceae archaeon]|nr:winged helix-turn-helix domain-containing protein [Methanotrichaceae archaeon]
MTEMSIESVFGVKAGIVWEALNKIGPSTIGDIVKATGLRRELVYGALGWLGRENKIALERRGRALVFSLKP